MRWLLLLALAGCGGAVGRGADAIAAGDLPAATQILEGAAAGGQASGAVWFDLGTAWYLRGDLPRAVACWRHAARLRPRDADVQHDLALARSQLPGTPPPALGPVWARLATPGELGVLGALVAAAGSALALRWRRRRAGNGSLAAGLLGVGVTLGVLGTISDVHGRAHPTAVVLDGEIRARSMPQADATERFRLPAGSEVRVERDADDWVLVSDGRARRGWVSASALAIVAPGEAAPTVAVPVEPTPSPGLEPEAR